MKGYSMYNDESGFDYNPYLMESDSANYKNQNYQVPIDYYDSNNLNDEIFIPCEEYSILRKQLISRVSGIGLLGVFANYVKLLYMNRGACLGGAGFLIFIFMIVTIFCFKSYWSYYKYIELCNRYGVPLQCRKVYSRKKVVFCSIEVLLYFLVIVVSWFGVVFYPADLLRGVLGKDINYGAVSVNATIIEDKGLDGVLFNAGTGVLHNYGIEYEYKGKRYSSVISVHTELKVGESVTSVYIKPINPSRAYYMGEAKIFGIKDNGKMLNSATVVWFIALLMLSGFTRLYFPKRWYT